jgi:uncharacterized protein (TIGR00369 family)
MPSAERKTPDPTKENFVFQRERAASRAAQAGNSMGRSLSGTVPFLETDMYTGLPRHLKSAGRSFRTRANPGKSVAKQVKAARICPMTGKPHGHDTKAVKPSRNACFVCGPDNPEGMGLVFTLDERRRTFVCNFSLSDRYTGPPGHCHGGIIASILDDAMGKVNKLRQVIALTKEMTVEYIKPVPLHKPLRVEGREVSVHGRRHINRAEITNEEGEVLARSRGTFIAIDPEKMFGKFVER